MIRNWLMRFMAGRYGPDHLGVALIIAAGVFGIFGAFGLGIMRLLEYAALFIAMFRLLSRNHEKRRRENDKFLRFWGPFKNKLRLQTEKIKNRKNYRFFKCPSCGNTLRVPRGKGKLRVTCPKCGERFEKKT